MKNNLNIKARHASVETSFNPADDSQLTIIKSGDVKNLYVQLNNFLSDRTLYEPILFLNFEPQDRYAHRLWLQNLTVSFRIALYRMPYGSNFGTVNFIWKLPENDESSHCRAILTVTDQLPTFHSRQMQKDFTDKYKNSVKASVSMLQVMYQDLTGDSSAAVSIAQKQRREDIAKFLSEVDDEPNILLGL